MGRTFRGRKSSKRYGRVNKRRYGRKYGLRNRGRKSKFGRGRGMQRIQKRRYPARNPFGDKVQVKFKFTAGGLLTTAGVPQQYVQTVGAFNDLAQAETAFGACPGFTVYPTLFQNYRVTGVKIRYTPLVNANTPDRNSIQFVMGSDGVLLTPSLRTLPEQRWCKYTASPNFGGGPFRSTSLYLSTSKVGGADRSINVDEQYTSTTNTSAPFYNVVPQQLGFQYGLVNGSESNYTPNITIGSYMLSMTYYVSFWGRRTITQ